MIEVKLTGPRGDNPLGFLTALGVVATLEDAGVDASLSWNVLSPHIRFHPPSGPSPLVDAAICGGARCSVGHQPADPHGSALLQILHRQLSRQTPSEDDVRGKAGAKEQMERLATEIKRQEGRIKVQYSGRAALEDRNAAMEREVAPLRAQLDEARARYLAVLRSASVDLALTLGRNLAAKNHEFQNFFSSLFEEFAQDRARRNLDLAASYGVSDPNDPDESIESTPWALITGAGHQHFLETVGELMVNCGVCHLARAIFGPWQPNDERWSLRLDPADDRRYALLASDPTASNNKARTLWGANRLAFEALRFFPAYPVARTGIAVVAWKPSKSGGYRSDAQVRWPLWEPWLSGEAIRSMLALPDLWIDSPASRLALRQRGVRGVMTSRRIQVEKFFNLLPGAPVWMS